MKTVSLGMFLFLRSGCCWWVIGIFVPMVLWGGSDFPGEVTLIQEKGLWRASVQGDPIVEAQIGRDGNLIDLRFIQPGEMYGLVANSHRPSFVRLGTGLPDLSSFGGARGMFLYRNGPVRFQEVSRTGEDTILARGEAASVLYRFAPGKVVAEVTNHSGDPLQVLMVIDPSVKAVRLAGGDWLRTPVVLLGEETQWYQDGSSAGWQVSIRGGDRLWGPAEEAGKAWRQGLFQVWEATVQPGERRTIEVEATRMPETMREELEERFEGKIPSYRMAETAYQDPQAAVEGERMTLYSPHEYQVFQRQSRESGRVWVAGRFAGSLDSIEVRWEGQGLEGAVDSGWQEIDFNPISGGFGEWLEVAAGGWYRYSVRALRGEEVLEVVAVEHVGVGEVFVVCGQSNSTNYGQRSGETARTRTGRVSAFSGEGWMLAEDPFPGSTDGSQGGSPWTYFGDALVERYDVPVAISLTGHGGAPVQRWTPGKFPFYWLMMRIEQLGPQGFRALLWHQGEANARRENDEYFVALSEIIGATRRVAGWEIPWMVAQVSYTGSGRPLEAWIRADQKRLWEEGIALEGPDTDTLLGENRVGVHFSTVGLRNHGELWAEKVGSYLDEIFAESEV
ncbi:MAG: sialate O-acetylesterase, partial [Puniceicoccales bacterium]